ncbi:hypothetical protein BJY01DRAFT_29407 [Aspergillus pseudoustus]|uniref:Uncharacterized protein n=1 Tax=Aspergillus pseudoustus TaxID=1810923 RepID=A0ABR4JJA4_9EURO
MTGPVFRFCLLSPKMILFCSGRFFFECLPGRHILSIARLAVGRQRYRSEPRLTSTFANKKQVSKYSKWKGDTPVIDNLESSHCLHCDGLIVSFPTIDGSTCYVDPQSTLAQEQLARLRFSFEAGMSSHPLRISSDPIRCLPQLDLHVICRARIFQVFCNLKLTPSPICTGLYHYYLVTVTLCRSNFCDETINQVNLRMRGLFRPFICKLKPWKIGTLSFVSVLSACPLRPLLRPFLPG